MHKRACMYCSCCESAAAALLWRLNTERARLKTQDDPKNFTFECVVPPPDSVAATVVPPKKPVLPLRSAALPSVADMPFIPPENWTGGLATSVLPGICNADLPSDSTRNRYIWVRGAAMPCSMHKASGILSGDACSARFAAQQHHQGHNAAQNKGSCNHDGRTLLYSLCMWQVLSLSISSGCSCTLHGWSHAIPEPATGGQVPDR